MNAQIHAVTDAPGYSELYDQCAELVESSPCSRLASAALLNAAMAIALTTVGPEVLEVMLRRAIELVPAEDARAHGHIN
jgi:hypothetical protein